MQKLTLVFFYCILFVTNHSFGQNEFIRSKEGKPILNRRQFVASCLKGLHKDRTDKTANAICNCEADKVDFNFSMKQYRKHTKIGLIDLDNLIKSDSVLEKKINDCYLNSGQTTLLQAEGFEQEFVNSCKKWLKRSTEKTLDDSQATNFCNCQLELVKTKKITDAEMQTLSNPNSLLFYEMMYKCGDPFSNKNMVDHNWSKNSAIDIIGPNLDSINVLTLNGMTYVKVKIGTLIQIWLFDTGASDLLINTEMEENLKKENILTETNYIGNGEYEMANGVIDTCRKYKIDNLQIGHFTINNVIIAVSEKAKRLIIGKSLINKFSNCTLNNQNNMLILTK